MPHRRSLAARTRMLAALVCILLLTAGAAEAKRRGKPKPTPTPAPQTEATPAGDAAPAPPPAGLEAVGENLWRYQTAAARESLGRFLDQADANTHVAAAYGRVLEQEKKYGDAEARLRKATELAPGDPAAQVYLGEVLLRQRRDGDANAAFARAAELARARGGGEAAYYLGIAQQRLRQYDDAVATLRNASAPAPALVPYQIGVTRAFQESWQPAVDELNRAIEMDSGLAYAYYYRGLAYEKLGRKDMLINDLERFLALAPSAPEAERAQAILRAVKR